MWFARASLVLVIALASCEAPRRAPPPPRPPPDPALVRSSMQEHAEAADELHRAILEGRLGVARARARQLVWTDRAWVEEGPRSYELVAAADTIAHARDLVTAAGGMGRLASACGACHERAGARIEDTTPPPSFPSAPGLVAQMARHNWAAQRLWAALVLPSDRAWREGTNAIGGATLDLARTTNAKPNERVVELAEHLGDVALRATSVDDRTLRATIYGEMLVTCARCHTMVRPGHRR